MVDRRGFLTALVAALGVKFVAPVATDLIWDISPPESPFPPCVPHVECILPLEYQWGLALDNNRLWIRDIERLEMNPEPGRRFPIAKDATYHIAMFRA